MMQALSRARQALWLGGSLLVLLALPLSSCGDGDSLASSESPGPAVDSTPPPDSTTPPPDTTTPPPTDTTPPLPPDTTTPPPPDSTLQPGECPPVTGSSPAPVHVGLALGPTHVPPGSFGDLYTGTQITALTSSCLLADLEKARRANVRVFISFTGNEQHNRDENGFSFTKWKSRVDRFRDADLTPYIEDGTILAHLLMDEPTDPNNWNGKIVTHQEINDMANYSKEVWPTMSTYIRTWPEYLIGGQFPNLDALWFHYLDRWGDLDAFLEKHLGDLRQVGLKVIGGLNVLNGGSDTSGIPGKGQGKHAMSADEVRTWGAKFFAEPNMCAFLLWEWDAEYLARPDIRAAVEELAAKARAYPKQSCAR